MHRGAAAWANCKLIGVYLVHVGSPSHPTNYQIELISVQLRRLVKVVEMAISERASLPKADIGSRPQHAHACALRAFCSAMLVCETRTSAANGAIIDACQAPPLPAGGKVGKPMDERIEAFLKDVLALDGEISNLLREGVRRYLTICEKQFRDAETNKRMKDRAVQACRTLCRMRVAEEIRRRKGTSTAEHLKVVLGIIDSAALFPMNDD
jgi:hypothetical protein